MGTELRSLIEKKTLAISFYMSLAASVGQIPIMDDWDNGYYIAYPDDGSKPYAISPAYVRQNYELV